MTRGNDFSDQTRRPDTDINSQPTVDETIHTRPATPDEIAYRNGYAEAREEERVREDLQRTRENNSAASGIVIGIILTSIVGLTVAAIALWSQDRQPNAPTVAPSPTQPQPTVSPQTTQPQNRQTTERTTIIERAPQQTEIIVPPAPAPATQSQPAQPPVTQPPVTQPNPTQPQTNSGTSTLPTQPSDSTTNGTTDSTTVPPTGSDSSPVGQ